MTDSYILRRPFPPREVLLDMYRKMVTIRRFEETGMEMYRKGFIRGYFHAYSGQEAIATGACATLRRDDYIVSTHRGHGHCIAKGADIRLMMAELFGKVDGYAGGRGGSMHISDYESGNIGANGIVGGGIPLAAGVGLGIRQEGSNRVVVCFFGDGAPNNGVFAETLNLASVYHLPVIFIIENNRYAATTPYDRTARADNLAERACGYGLPYATIFGNDPVLVYDTVDEAVRNARSSGGPMLIEADTYRHFGHHVNDPGHYMPREVLDDWKMRDPIDFCARYCVEAGIDADTLSKIDSEVVQGIGDAVKFAEDSPLPDPDVFRRAVARFDAQGGCDE